MIVSDTSSLILLATGDLLGVFLDEFKWEIPAYFVSTTTENRQNNPMPSVDFPQMPSLGILSL
jgi:hypothetical protein